MVRRQWSIASRGMRRITLVHWFGLGDRSFGMTKYNGRGCIVLRRSGFFSGRGLDRIAIGGSRIAGHVGFGVSVHCSQRCHVPFRLDLINFGSGRSTCVSGFLNLTNGSALRARRAGLRSLRCVRTVGGRSVRNFLWGFRNAINWGVRHSPISGV